MVQSRRFFAQLAFPALAAGLLLCPGCSPSNATKAKASTEAKAALPDPYDPAKPVVVPESDTMTLETDLGAITIALDLKAAPNSAYQVKYLAASGFYNGTGFHRVRADRMIQGGDPNTRDKDFSDDGAGEARNRIPFEPNDLPMTAGTVAMARGKGKDSASSQFFILLVDFPEWQGQYTPIGRVTAGLDVVKKISETPTLSDNPSHPREMPIILRVRFAGASTKEAN